MCSVLFGISWTICFPSGAPELLWFFWAVFVFLLLFTDLFWFVINLKDSVLKTDVTMNKKKGGGERDCNHTCTLEVTDYCCALTARLNFALVELTESRNGAKVVSELSGYCREESLQLEDKNVYITSKFTTTKTEIFKKRKLKILELKVFWKSFVFKWIILYFKCE